MALLVTAGIVVALVVDAIPGIVVAVAAVVGVGVLLARDIGRRGDGHSTEHAHAHALTTKVARAEHAERSHHRIGH